MNEFKERRIRFMEQMGDNSIAVFFAGEELQKSEDEAYPFTVNNNFYYLTGLDKAGMILVMTKLNGSTADRMFILPYDEWMAKWVGGRLKADEVQKISEVNTVNEVNELDAYIAGVYNRCRSYGGMKVYLDLWYYSSKQQLTPAILYAKKIKELYLNTEIIDSYPLLTGMRLIKSEDEIKKISKAIDITRSGVHAMMKNIRPGMNEMMMEGIFNFALCQRGCKENAFATIAASGERATVLHYSDNDQVMEDGELFLCDLGATFDHYCADISRTFPVNGKFTNRQKEIYNVVLAAQKLVENNAHPGIGIRDLNQMVIDFYKEELPKIGLTKEVREYYFHGIGHQLGLDVHDVDHAGQNVLKPGMVITNEPGLYVADEKIGIRIENDLLITEDGCVDLAKDIVREVEDIEKLMIRK